MNFDDQLTAWVSAFRCGTREDVRKAIVEVIAEARKPAPCDHEWGRGIRDTVDEPMISTCKKCQVERVVMLPMAPPKESIFDTACEAYAARRKELEASASCPACHGTGEVPDRHDPLGDTHPSKMETCEECDGHGVVEKQPSPQAVWSEHLFVDAKGMPASRCARCATVYKEAHIVRCTKEALAMTVEKFAPEQPIDAAKAWRERAWDACVKDAYNRGAALPSHRAIWPALDEAVALITAAEQRTGMRNAVIHDLQKAVNERIEDCRRIDRERDTAQDALEMLQDTTAQMQKIIDIVVKERDAAIATRDTIQREVERSHRALNESVQRERDAVKRAEAAEAECGDLREQVGARGFSLLQAAHDELESERDDLRARLAKLLAACEAFRSEEFATDNGWTLFVQAIAEARSGATDAPQAKEAT